ncbi:MAG: hypothetical protein J5X22_01610 [Candidatus Accumulibacter sp.]|uniref:hypothetical protein n=1 Tax=Accumulibacter sp. TaxID=2053492 RepID=UPI001AC88D71|nr:hypothetical protein [Accumulibacter sp.]MBN8517161.1 hypothetical protein [Accumulibacter sp.]MBO3709246.1 hypothetical protein [Accumulibacter sp.]
MTAHGIDERDRYWRERRRARTIPLLDKGLLIDAAVFQQQIHDSQVSPRRVAT